LKRPGDARPRGKIASMPRIRDVVFDCHRPAPLARFWVAVLDGYAIAPYDEADLEKLRAMGIDDPEDDPTVLALGPEDEPRLWFQKVPESKTAKNRCHVDLLVEDLEAETERILALGASLLEDQPPPEKRLAAFADPEGNEFCLITS
jgi:catechol 2,3-dioxygenase-like lactoylglutathione lyase family enzyme